MVERTQFPLCRHKLNEHWYNDIAAAKELSIQIDENDNHITATEDAVLDQPLQKKNTSTDKLNKKTINNYTPNK